MRLTYEEYKVALLVAMNKDMNVAGWTNFQELQDKYDMPVTGPWSPQAMEELKSEGLIEARTAGGGNAYSIFGRLTSLGRQRAAESTMQLKPELLSQTNQVDTSFPPDFADAAAETVSGASWTGLPSMFVLTEQKRERLSLLLQEAEINLDSVGASNQEKAMARAYIVAAKSLADAPEPPVDLIWELINRANSLAGVASLFVSIIALFSAIAH